MTVQQRYDSYRLDAKRARRDERGFLVADAYLSRTGVLLYRRADGTTVRELRDDAAVFEPESLATFASAPLTVGHPSEPVGPGNVRQLEVGVVASEARRDGRFVAATVSVRDASTIARVESGELSELSVGYSVRIDEVSGEHEGERFDRRQSSIRANHIALLPKGGGRSGADVRIRLDGDSAELVEDESASARNDDAGESRKETRMAVKVRLDGVDLEFSEEGAAAVGKLQAAVEKATARADAAELKATTEEAKATKAAQDLAAANDPKVRADAVKARVALESSAAKVLGDEDVSALGDRDLRVKAIAKVSPEFKCDGRSDDGVAAAFDVLVSSVKREDAGLKVVAAVVGAAQTGGADKGPTLSDARAKRNAGGK